MGIKLKGTFFRYVDEQVTSEVPLPKRATAGASGYDFYSPERVVVRPGETVLLDTGIKFVTGNNDVWLMLMPRSGYGFKYGMRLCNTVGNIDSDYQNANNGGRIMAKITADKEFVIEKGDRFMQGVIVPCYLCENDDAEGERTGGFGSTGGMQTEHDTPFITSDGEEFTTLDAAVDHWEKILIPEEERDNYNRAEFIDTLFCNCCIMEYIEER